MSSLILSDYEISSTVPIPSIYLHTSSFNLSTFFFPAPPHTSLPYRFRSSYTNDPLVWHYPTRAGSAVAMFGAMKSAEEKLHGLSVPCFVQHGTHDLVRWEGDWHSSLSAVTSGLSDLVNYLLIAPIPGV